MEQIEITKYEANDGTMWDNEWDNEMSCLEHELLLNKTLVFLDENFKKVQFINLEQIFNDSYYIGIKKYEDIDLLQDISFYYGYDIPEELGNFYWNDEEQLWETLDSKIKEMESELSKLDKLKKAREILNNKEEK